MRPREVNLLGVAAGLGAATPGAQDGPATLRRLGLIADLTRAGHRVEDLGDVPGVEETDPHAPNAFVRRLPNILQVNRHTHDALVGTRRQRPDAFILIVGGDHSLAMGALGGLADTSRRLGLVWLDAHGDYNTPISSPSGNAHGMSLAVACGRGHVDLRSVADREPMVAESDVYLFGVRDLDSAEKVALYRSRVHLYDMHTWRAAGVPAAVVAAVRELAARCDHVHLSFDIDVLAPQYVPGTGTPVAGGLTPAEAFDVLRALSAQDLIGSAEYVEYNPHLDDEAQTTGALVRTLIAALMQTP